MKDSRHESLFTDPIVMLIGIVIAVLSPLAGLAYNSNGGFTAFLITCIPLSIGSMIAGLSLHYGLKEPNEPKVNKNC